MSQVTVLHKTEPKNRTIRHVVSQAQHARRYERARESLCQAYLAPGLDYDARLNALLAAAASALRLERAAVARLDGELISVTHSFNRSAPVALKEAPSVGSCLAAQVVQGTGIVTMEQGACHHTKAGIDTLGVIPERYAGVPLIIDGLLYGIVEFSGDDAGSGWSEDDISLITLASMFVTVAVETIYDIDAIRRSEIALIDHLTDIRDHVLPAN